MASKPQRRVTANNRACLVEEINLLAGEALPREGIARTASLRTRRSRLVSIVTLLTLADCTL